MPFPQKKIVMCQINKAKQSHICFECFLFCRMKNEVEFGICERKIGEILFGAWSRANIITTPVVSYFSKVESLLVLFCIKTSCCFRHIFL